MYTFAMTKFNTWQKINYTIYTYYNLLLIDIWQKNSGLLFINYIMYSNTTYTILVIDNKLCITNTGEKK